MISLFNGEFIYELVALFKVCWNYESSLRCLPKKHKLLIILVVLVLKNIDSHGKTTMYIYK